MTAISGGTDRQIIRTIGHSNRTLEELADILRTHDVALLVDIRKMPRSRTNPQFNAETLPDALAPFGIEYTQLPALGGLRGRSASPSPEASGAWRNASFRRYADYMQTPEFAAGVDELVGLARDRATAIMCAEALPWRCHRSLVADALVARGIAVEHLMSPAKAMPHTLRDFAVVEGTRVTYPGDEGVVPER